MARPRWSKIRRDLWGNKTRTILVVLSIAVGVFAVGMVSGAYAVLVRELQRSYLAVDPSSATLVTDGFDDDLVDAVRRMPEVADAEGRRTLNARIEVGPDEWRTIRLYVIPHYNDLRINRIVPQEGAWPPKQREVLIERNALKVANSEIGRNVQIEMPGGQAYSLAVVGTVHDVTLTPARIEGMVYGYISLDTLEWLGEPRTVTELNILVSENRFDEAHIQQVVTLVQDKIESTGRTVYSTQIPEPGRHPFQNTMSSLLFLLGAMGLLSLILSGFLVLNMISALLTQQVRQIGVMKTFGARTDQLMRLYFTIVLILGILALVLAVPLGIMAAGVYADFLSTLMNFDLKDPNIPAWVVIVDVAIGLLVPVAGALYPVLSSVRMTVREAISSNGLSTTNFGTSFLDRMLGALRGLSRPVLLAIRNTFRRRARLVYTLITLVMGGAIFTSVLAVRESMLLTLDDAFTYRAYDLDLRFSRFYSDQMMNSVAQGVPGVLHSEAWTSTQTRRVHDDDTDGKPVVLNAVPHDSQIVKPSLMSGRWLVPEDQQAIVINNNYVEDEPDLKVGDEFVLKIGERDIRWKIVGIVREVMGGPAAYVNQSYYQYLTSTVGQSNNARIQIAEHDEASQATTLQEIERAYSAVGFDLLSTVTLQRQREDVANHFEIIIGTLTFMALLISVVGGFSLAGTMSINVLERTREIGVMRAIGASNHSVLRIFISEGIFIGMISWVMATLIAIPCSRLMSDFLGVIFVETPLTYTFSVSAVLIWLGLVLLLTAIASFAPSWRASQLTVRDVLAYE